MSLIEITNRIEAFKTELADKTKAFETERDSLRKRIDALMKERQIVNDGLDLNQIQIAEECMIFQGNPGEVRHGAYSDQDRSSVRGKAIQDAIRIIASTDDPFRKEYIGVKNYSGFGDQREDHSNGMGPRHGSIVFSIRRRAFDGTLTEEQRNACIYYLMNWQKIYQAKPKAA